MILSLLRAALFFAVVMGGLVAIGVATSPLSPVRPSSPPPPQRPGPSALAAVFLDHMRAV